MPWASASRSDGDRARCRSSRRAPRARASRSRPWRRSAWPHIWREAHVRGVCHVAHDVSAPSPCPRSGRSSRRHGDELLVHARRLAGDAHGEDVAAGGAAARAARLSAPAPRRSPPRVALPHHDHDRHGPPPPPRPRGPHRRPAGRRDRARALRRRVRVADRAASPTPRRPRCGCASSTTSTTTAIAARARLHRPSPRASASPPPSAPSAPREPPHDPPPAPARPPRRRRRRRGPRRRRLHAAADADRHAHRRPGRRAASSASASTRSDVDALLAEVAAGLGPRIVASDPELAATRDALEAYFEGDGRAPRPARRLLARALAVPPRRAARSCARVGAGEVVTYGRARRAHRPPAGRRGRSARRARRTRSRSSSPATGCCPARAASATTAAARRSSAACSPTRARLLLLTPRRYRLMTIGSVGLLVGADRGDADQVDDLLALGDLAEQRVLGRQAGVLAGDHEELAAGRARRPRPRSWPSRRRPSCR